MNFFLLIMAAITVVGVVIMGIVIHKRSMKYDAMFLSLASKRNGSVTGATLCKDPILHLVENGENIDVYFEHNPVSKSSTPYYTIFQTKLERSGNYSIHIHRNLFGQFWSSMSKRVGLQDIEVHDPEFDEAFVVKSSSEMFVLNFLNMDIRKLLMRSMAKWPLPGIAIKEGILQFYIQDELLDCEADYDEFIDSGIFILNRLKQM